MRLDETVKINLRIASVIALVVGIITSSFALGEWTKKLDDTALNVGTNTIRIERLEEANHSRDVQYAEIQKDLKYIIEKLEKMQ